MCLFYVNNSPNVELYVCMKFSIKSTRSFHEEGNVFNNTVTALHWYIFFKNLKICI